MLPAPPELFFAKIISGSSIVKVVDSIVVVVPLMVKLPPTVTLPDDSIVVNFPDAAVAAPIATLSIEPVVVPVMLTVPLVEILVNVPGDAELAPIVVPSIAPPLMSTVLDSKVTPLDTTNFLSTVICSELLVVTKVM